MRLVVVGAQWKQITDNEDGHDACSGSRGWATANGLGAGAAAVMCPRAWRGRLGATPSLITCSRKENSAEGDSITLQLPNKMLRDDGIRHDGTVMLFEILTTDAFIQDFQALPRSLHPCPTDTHPSRLRDVVMTALSCQLLSLQLTISGRKVEFDRRGISGTPSDERWVNAGSSMAMLT